MGSRDSAPALAEMPGPTDELPGFILIASIRLWIRHLVHAASLIVHAALLITLFRDVLNQSTVSIRNCSLL